MHKLKRFVLMAFVLGAMFPDLAKAQVNFIKNDWDSLKSFALRDQKLIFVDAYTDWCYWCKVMDQKTFTDSSVAAFMNAHFINTKIEMQKETLGQILAMKYSVKGFPSFLIFDPYGTLVYSSFGYETPETFIATLEKAVKSENFLKQPGYSTNMHPNYPDFYKRHFIPNDTSLHATDSAGVNQYLLSQETLFDEVNWAVIKVYYWWLGSEVKYAVFKEHQKFISLYGLSEVDKLLSTLLRLELDKAIATKDEEAMEVVASKAVKFISTGNESANFMRNEFYLETNNWKKLKPGMDSYIAIKGGQYAAYINEVCWAIYERCDDAEVTLASLNWMTEALKVDPQYNHMDTYASLLYKTGQLDKAEAFAKRTIEIGKANRENVKATKELLKKIKKEQKAVKKKK